MIFLISDHIEVTGTGEAEDDVLGFAGFFAFKSLVDSYADRVGALGCRQDSFYACEHFSCFEDIGLLDGNSFHKTVVVELGENGAHAVIAQAACVVRRRDEIAAQRVHLGERADHTGVAEVIGVNAAGEAGAGSRLNGNDAVVRLTAQLFAHERSDEAAKVGAAAGAADNHVGLDAVFIERRLGLETDDGLVQKDLIEYGPEHVTVTGIGDRDFHCLGDRAAQRTGCAGVLGEDLTADLRRVGRGRSHGSTVGAHNFAAEGFLFIAHLDHVDFAIEVKIGAGHRQCCAPLTGAGFGRDTFEALFLGVISLRNRRVELVASARVVALELVINMCGSLQLLLKTVCAHQR